MPDLYPDLELDICGEIYNAVARELGLVGACATGQPLRPVFVSDTDNPQCRVYTVDSIPVAIDDGKLTSDVPALLIAPGPVVETRIGNQGYTELRTAVDLGLLTGILSLTQTHDWLRQRIFRAIKRRLMREEGTLRGGSGAPGDPRLTDALQGFGRIEPSGRLKRSTNILLTTFRVTFRSDIDEATGAFIE